MTTPLTADAVVWLPYEPKELDGLGLPEQFS
ncbi:hypothetical protein QFZ32_000549 [Streptomyces canus]|nr:hypothetical protein [Streptomyces canus]MDQ1065110.1 hypothetical protein [Streptomyces canus]